MFVSLFGKVPGTDIPEAAQTQGDIRVHAGRNVEAFLEATKYISEKSASPFVKGLVHELRELIRNGHVHVMMSLVHSAHFVGVKKEPVPVGMLMLPMNWYVMWDRNPEFEAGEVVCMASRAKDFYNGRFFEDAAAGPVGELGTGKETNNGLWNRGKAFEAEWLLSHKSDWPLSDSQKKLMQDFPSGIAGVDATGEPNLFYESKPIDERTR
jgi:hypothetical protein